MLRSTVDGSILCSRVTIEYNREKVFEFLERSRIKSDKTIVIELYVFRSLDNFVYVKTLARCLINLQKLFD